MVNSFSVPVAPPKIKTTSEERTLTTLRPLKPKPVKRITSAPSAGRPSRSCSSRFAAGETPTVRAPCFRAARATRSGRPVVAPVTRIEPRAAIAAPSRPANPPSRAFFPADSSPADAPITPTFISGMKPPLKKTPSQKRRTRPGIVSQGDRSGRERTRRILSPHAAEAHRIGPERKSPGPAADSRAFFLGLCYIVAVAKIPILDLQAQYQTIRDEARRAIDEVLESQQFVLGPAVEKFEREAAAYLGGKHAVGVASGSDALLLALMALGIGPGDGVIVPPFTFFATVSAITRLGATPLFADIDPESVLLDVKQVETLLTDRKKPVARIQAVLPVHLFGRIAPMAELAALAAAHSLHIVEDVAQAFGARAGAKAAGAIGDLGCFSFFPSKNLGGAGDGGLILTDRPELAEKLRLLRAHGESSKYRHELVGLNSRLDSIQAALLSVKLRRIDAWCEERIRRAGRYGELFRAAGLVGNGVRAVPAAGAGPGARF